MLAPISDATLPAVLALNNAHAQETSALTRAELQALLSDSFLALESGAGVDGFLISLGSGASCASPNFLWFAQRYDSFVYIDRVVVAAHARGQGLARRFYEAVFAQALAEGVPRIACEVNIDPPNPVSDAFHAALGFTEVGRAALLGRGKTVRYLLRSPAPPGRDA